MPPLFLALSLLLLLLLAQAHATTFVVPNIVTVYPGLAVPTFVATFHSTVPSSPGALLLYSQPVCPSHATYTGITTPVPITSLGGDGSTYIACALNVTLPYNASISVVTIVAPPLSMTILLEKPRGVYNVSALAGSSPLVMAPGHQTLKFVVYGPSAASDPVCHDLTFGFYNYGYGEVFGTPTAVAVASPPGSHSCAYNVTVAPSLYSNGAAYPKGLKVRFPIANNTDDIKVTFGITDPAPSHGPPPSSVTNAPTGRTLCAITGCTLRVVVVRNAVRTMIPSMPQTNLTTTATLVAIGAGITTAVNSTPVTIVSQRTIVANQADTFYARVDTTYEFSFNLIAYSARLNATNASEATVTVRGVAFDFFGTPPGWSTTNNATLATFAVYFPSPVAMFGRNATASRVANDTRVDFTVPLVLGLAYAHDSIATVNYPAIPNPPPLFPRAYVGGNVTEHSVQWGVGSRFTINGLFVGRGHLPCESGHNVTIVTPYFDGQATWLPIASSWNVAIPPCPTPPLTITCIPGNISYTGNRTFTCTFIAASTATLPVMNPWQLTLGKLTTTPHACTSTNALAHTCTFLLVEPTPLATTSLTMHVRTADGVYRTGPTLPLAPAWILTDTGGLSLYATVLRGPVGHVIGSAPNAASPPPNVTVTLTFAPHGVTRTVTLPSVWLDHPREWLVHLALLPGDLVDEVQTTLHATVHAMPMWLDGAWTTTTRFASNATVKFGEFNAYVPRARPPRPVVVDTPHLLEVVFEEKRWTHSRWWTGVLLGVFVVWILARLAMVEIVGWSEDAVVVLKSEMRPLLPFASSSARRRVNQHLW